MKHNIYGNKMFVIDLTITTLWSFLTLRYSIGGAFLSLVFIIMRISLCFEMYRKSPWTVYSTMAFIISYIDYIFREISLNPIKLVVHFVGGWFGEGAEVVEAFRGDLSQQTRMLLYSINTILNVWLIGLPVIVGIVQKNRKAISWNHKWIWFYILIAFVISSWIGFYEYHAFLFAFGLILSFMPILYWCLYKRNGRSIVALLEKDKSITLYARFVVLFSLCVFIGICDINLFKALGLTGMLPVFYMLICKGYDYKPLTRHVVALSICGLLLYSILLASETLKIITLSISFLLAIYVGLYFIIKCHNKWMAFIMVVMPFGIMAPIILGLNPYCLLEVDSISKYGGGYYCNNGVFIIKKDDKYGLRDRYGLILNPEYDRINRLGKWNRYITVNLNEGCLIADNRFGVYDLITRQFLLDPKSVEVSQINQTSESRFELIDPNGRHFSTLLLPGYRRENSDFINYPLIDPFHEPKKMKLQPDSTLLQQEIELGDCQHGDNMASYRLLDEVQVKTDLQFKKIIDKVEDYRIIYIKWSDLMESMSNYLVEVTYGEPYYSMMPIQFNHDIRKWYETTIPDLIFEYDIIFNNKLYEAIDSLKIPEDYIEYFFQQYKPLKDGGYNRMWNEIKPAFNNWIYARNKFAESLSPHQRLSFENHTQKMSTVIFREIQALIETRNDNVIYERKSATKDEE